MEELLEIITWSQLGIHEKPVSLALLFITIKYYIIEKFGLFRSQL